MDSNHDKQNQNLLCYRYTTGLRGTGLYSVFFRFQVRIFGENV